jgi:arylsulfatase A-like enzyme
MKSRAEETPRRSGLSATSLVALVIAFGLIGGYVDVCAVVFKKYFWDEDRYFWEGRDFPWTIPVAHVVLMLIPAILVAIVNRVRPGRVSASAVGWLFATYALWAALLRMPIHGFSSLILAAGVGGLLSRALITGSGKPRGGRYTIGGLLSVLVVLAAVSSGSHYLREVRALARLPAAPPNARNVLFIVWDTVRARNLSAYGYQRETTPNLQRWVKKGVRYDLALAPAPWTYPSHSSFFTGRWPFKLNSQWKHNLDAPDPTIAEFLVSKGYQTAGFAANTGYCSYETGLDRGFVHFEDYPLTPQFVLSRTMHGLWILNNIVSPLDFYNQKWLRFQSRDALGVNLAFLDWLRKRRTDRPFFAFLNYLDAHAPYIPPSPRAYRFGLRPKSYRDYHFLMQYWRIKKDGINPRDVLMARDCYDDCIAYLDEHLGLLLEELREQGILDNTLVVITSDHGEEFGDHGMFLHASSLYLDALHVPLVILAPGAPAGRTVSEPVSLCDLPATVVERAGLSEGSPFPGRSLAAYWSEVSHGRPPGATPAFSELANLTAFQPQPPEGGTRPAGGLVRRGFQMSVVRNGHHYVRDGNGSEQLYDLNRDLPEQVNLKYAADGDRQVDPFRRALLDVIVRNPGTPEVEAAYLKPYRQWLQSLVRTREDLSVGARIRSQ